MYIRTEFFFIVFNKLGKAVAVLKTAKSYMTEIFIQCCPQEKVVNPKLFKNYMIGSEIRVM